MKMCKQTMKKISAFVLAFAMMVSMVSFPVQAEATQNSDTKMLYLNTGGSKVWDQAGAWFQAWIWGAGDQWVTLKQTDVSGIYAAEVPVGTTGAKVLRKAPEHAANTWTSWNESGDQDLTGNNNLIIVDTDWNYSVGHYCYDLTDDDYCDLDSKIMSGCVVTKGNTLTLDGKIGVNFYMDIATDVLNDSNANVIFTFNGVEADPIPVKNGAEKDGYRVYTYYVVAKEMTDDITAKVVTNDGEKDVVLAECTASVQGYAETILTDEKYSKERELVKAMLRYGAYSQTYFKDYNKENKADSILQTLFPEETDPVTSYKIDGKYMPAATAPTTKYSATSLLLESDVVLRHYFNDNENVGGTETKDGYYYIDIDSIPAHELSVGKTINVDNVDITYSPFNYAYTVLNDEKEDLALENLMKAMCMYGDAAYAYKNPQQ